MIQKNDDFLVCLVWIEHTWLPGDVSTSRCCSKIWSRAALSRNTAGCADAQPQFTELPGINRTCANQRSRVNVECVRSRIMFCLCEEVRGQRSQQPGVRMELCDGGEIRAKLVWGGFWRRRRNAAGVFTLTAGGVRQVEEGGAAWIMQTVNHHRCRVNKGGSALLCAAGLRHLTWRKREITVR